MSRAAAMHSPATSLSRAWAKPFLALVRHEASEFAPLTLRIDHLHENGELEDASMRDALDALLASTNQTSVQTVANTIFPESAWIAAGGDRHKFFADFRRVYPRIIKLDIQNRKGTYFGRLVESLPDMPEGQLDHIIWLAQRPKSVVRLKLQAAIFDARRDHDRGARPNFPCMQQISFAPHDGLLSVNAFYASQQLLLKGYGNYLGIIRLGRFMAEQMGLQLESINVLAGLAKIEGPRRGTAEFRNLVTAAERVMAVGGER